MSFRFCQSPCKRCHSLKRRAILEALDEIFFSLAFFWVSVMKCVSVLSRKPTPLYRKTCCGHCDYVADKEAVFAEWPCSNICLLLYEIMKHKDLNYLCKHRKKVNFNPAQNIWHKVRRYNKIGQEFKNISNFACFLTAIASVWFLEGRLGIGLRLHPHLTFF